jgi:hypothetical protein
LSSATLRIIQSVDPALPVGFQLAMPASGGVIGRSADVDLCLPGNTVSRRHARLVPGEGGWHVEPLTTTNAVFVDGEPRTTIGPLPSGASLQIGGVVCVVVSEAGTTPVLHRLDDGAWLFEVHDDGGQCTVHVQETLLDIPPSAARCLSALIAEIGRPVHRWDLLEALGENANLDKAISLLRRGLREALEEGVLDAPRMAEALREAGATVDDEDPAALVKELIVTRRGHGYMLRLAAHRARRIVR